MAHPHGTRLHASSTTSDVPGLILTRVRTLRLSQFTLNPESVAFMGRALIPHIGTLVLNGCRAIVIRGHRRTCPGVPPAPYPGSHSVPETAAQAHQRLPFRRIRTSLRSFELARGTYSEPVVEWLMKVSAYAVAKVLSREARWCEGYAYVLHVSGASLQSLYITLTESGDASLD